MNPDRRRIVLSGGELAEPLTLWAEYAPDGSTPTFTLLLDYPDLELAVGLSLECRGELYTVEAVEGRTLVCRPVAGER